MTAQTPLGELTVLADPLAGGDGARCPLPRTPHSLSALRASDFGPSSPSLWWKKFAPTKKTDATVRHRQWVNLKGFTFIKSTTSVDCLVNLVSSGCVARTLGNCTCSNSGFLPKICCCRALRFPVEKQEQQRVADGPRNAQCMSIRQVSLRRGTCGHCSVARRCCCRCYCYKAMC